MIRFVFIVKRGEPGSLSLHFIIYYHVLCCRQPFLVPDGHRAHQEREAAGGALPRLAQRHH
jgi:hypothetical protein